MLDTFHCDIRCFPIGCMVLHEVPSFESTNRNEKTHSFLIIPPNLGHSSPDLLSFCLTSHFTSLGILYYGQILFYLFKTLDSFF